MTIVKPTKALGNTLILIPHLNRHLHEFPKGVAFQAWNKESLRVFLQTHRRLIQNGYIEVEDTDAKPAKTLVPTEVAEGSEPKESEEAVTYHHGNQSHKRSNKK